MTIHVIAWSAKSGSFGVAGAYLDKSHAERAKKQLAEHSDSKEFSLLSVEVMDHRERRRRERKSKSEA